MKEGRTLASLAQELERQANAKRDVLVSAIDLCIHTNGSSALQLISRDESYPLNEIANAQLAEYLAVPKAFYDRLRTSSLTLRVPLGCGSQPGSRGEPASWPARVEQDEPLFDLVVNRLLREKGEERRLVRTLDGRARAVLSDSYNPDLDNFDLFRMAARVLQEAGLGPQNVLSCEVTERKLYLKVVSPKIQATIHPSNLHREHGGHFFLKEPQVIQAGVLISNSEVGQGAVKIEQTVFKLACTNLWVIETAYRTRHLGRMLEADDEGQVYRSDTRMAEARARLLKVRDHVADALNEAHFHALVERIQETTEVPLGKSVEKTVEASAKRFSLSQTEKDSVLRNLIGGADLSLWGLSNAITATAGEASDYDRATELEVIGGRCLAMSKGQVNELITA